MDEGVWEAARCIRPCLEELLDSATAAAEVDAQLAGLLTGGDAGEDTEDQLREVLDAHPATSGFLFRVLDDAPAYRPPPCPRVPRTRGYAGLPGDWAPVEAEKFACPRGDYVWYLPETRVSIPACPTHQQPLQRV
ncbi:hypothetical protein [Kocuria arenosa]|uniref:hypothetical protein n=1 Tax=Kocuria arenosa TaxID=3071446 RepID=UPI0034D6527F